MSPKLKRRGVGLDIKTFAGRDGRSYLVFRTPSGSFHTFVETEAKDAARECGDAVKGNTRRMWKDIWSAHE
jgi:hypothetical protein